MSFKTLFIFIFVLRSVLWTKFGVKLKNRVAARGTTTFVFMRFPNQIVVLCGTNIKNPQSRWDDVSRESADWCPGKRSVDLFYKYIVLVKPYVGHVGG